MDNNMVSKTLVGMSTTNIQNSKSLAKARVLNAGTSELMWMQVQIPRSPVMMENQTREEVMTRIKAGWSCFGRFKDILCDRKLPMSLRRRKYDQCVIPTMT